VAAHVPRLHDRLVQAAARFNWSVGVVMLVLTRCCRSPVPAAVGPAGDLGHHRRIEHGARRRSWVTKGGAQLLRLGDVPLIHAADDARFALLGGTFVGEGALLQILRAALRRAAARDRRAHGGPFLARA
jgi:hypothetical protein